MREKITRTRVLYKDSREKKLHPHARYEGGRDAMTPSVRKKAPLTSCLTLHTTWLVSLKKQAK